MQFNWSEPAKAHGIDPNKAADEGHTEWLKWHNRKCDILALCCHIFCEKDLFVTREVSVHPTERPKKTLSARQNAVAGKLEEGSRCHRLEVGKP